MHVLLSVIAGIVYAAGFTVNARRSYRIYREDSFTKLGRMDSEGEAIMLSLFWGVAWWVDALTWTMRKVVTAGQKPSAAETAATIKQLEGERAKADLAASLAAQAAVPVAPVDRPSWVVCYASYESEAAHAVHQGEELDDLALCGAQRAYQAYPNVSATRKNVTCKECRLGLKRRGLI
jgi:hypothetical protein